ncbi:hypothetical protein [Nocardioides massiliensis]|uniref:Uncharacterized protein n=1 Tax=Nocardioides massiliensis TaxID=1325935 RepID=A0ABT9NKJ6_9ACTN|nr:hypothetical protein [Nocardioides massiliensis]MDP9820370.1 hypothetical protein [Nocardioides massiliensis]
MKRISLGRDTSGRPLDVDSRTLAKLRAAERRLGHKFVIVQGSYRGGAGAKASAGTHDRAGVIDLRTYDLPASITPQAAVKALREAGLIAWYRTKAQGFDPHIHAIDYGNPDLHPSAANQVRAWEQGRNGLASNGPDDGPRVTVPKSLPPDPTPGVTRFLNARTLKQRRKLADGLAKNGDTAAIRRHAKRWLNRDAKAQKWAKARAASYRALRKLEVK